MKVDEFEAITSACGEAGRIIRQAQEHAALIRAHALEDAALIRAKAVEDVRVMGIELRLISVDLAGLVQASTQFSVKKAGRDLVRRLNAFLDRHDRWVIGSANWSELTPEPDPEFEVSGPFPFGSS